MTCTKQKWCDFVSYDPLLKRKLIHFRVKIQHVQRNNEQIERIDKAVETFLAEIKQETQILTQTA